MEYKIYVQNNCPFCNELVIPEGVKAEKVYIDNEEYTGYRPHSVPVLQLVNFELNGPHQINEFLNLVY